MKITDGDESLDKIVHIPALSPKEVARLQEEGLRVDTNDVEKWIAHGAEAERRKNGA